MSTAANGSGPSDRAILRALLRATREVDDVPGEDPVWSTLAFEPDALRRELAALQTGEGEASELGEFAQELALGYRVRRARWDDLSLQLPFGEREAEVPRSLVGEALGPLGSELFPTRRSARQTAIETARELAYFGCGPIEELLLPCPIRGARQALGLEGGDELGGVLLEETDPRQGERRWDIYELLAADEFVHRKVADEGELARFQERLREDPLDGAMVTRLREFFTRRLTVGLRDSARWSLGSRHPWFSWKRARALIDGAFERWGRESFYTPRWSLYTYDLEASDEELERLLDQNRDAVSKLVGRLRIALSRDFPAPPSDELLEQIAAATLDYRYDHPDFDLEATGRSGDTTLAFLSRAAFNLASAAVGKPLGSRPNRNFAAHFALAGVAEEWLSALDTGQRGAFFQTLRRELRQALKSSTGLNYRRPPLTLYTFHEAPVPRPRPGERVLDSFRLSQLRAPHHAVHLSRHPELGEKLVVFFSLVLRHYLDTDHILDLRPERLVRDFLLLGIWGYDSTHLWICLYEDESTGEVRSELRYLGRAHQIKRFRPQQDRSHEGVLTRKAVARLGPLMEPSMLRSLGNFLMVVEENQVGHRESEMGAVPFLKHSLELFRETARTTVRGTLVDLATGLEMVVDGGVDAAQGLLDRVQRLRGRAH